MAKRCSKYTDHKKKYNTGSHLIKLSQCHRKQGFTAHSWLKFWLTLVWKELGLTHRHESPSSILIRIQTHDTRGNSATCNICNSAFENSRITQNSFLALPQIQTGTNKVSVSLQNSLMCHLSPTRTHKKNAILKGDVKQ